MSHHELLSIKVENLSREEAVENAELLRDAVEYHNNLYYVKNEPKISDAEYDQLKRKLWQLEERYPDLATADSPTRKIGAEPVAAFGLVWHEPPMLSLQDAKEKGDTDNC